LLLRRSMVLSWRVPDAALPPPFPSSRPQRLYISNMAVAPAARRRGIALALLASAEAAAAAWGQPELWLHVDAGNVPARALYAAAGFSEAPEGQDGWWVPQSARRVLLRKPVPPRRWPAVA
jgi:ribosomal protein S18 acetylase RimI-like enzyme